MKLREFRRRDAPAFFELLKSEFPEEERMVGVRPEGFEQVMRRLYRLDVRILLGLLRAFHRAPFHIYVMEDGARIAGTTLLSFGPQVGFLSTVVVAPAYRRRGLARQLIERARAETASRRHPYVALRVLEQNTPARALYAAAGYLSLDRQTFRVQDNPAAFAAPPVSKAIRPFARDDAPALAELGNRLRSELARRVLPIRPQDLIGGSIADRLFNAETAGWVVDRGRGPEAHVGASVSPTTEAAHLTTPIVGEAVEPALAADLIRTAGAWVESRHAPRIVTSVADDAVAAGRALEEAGFRAEFAHFTLYRPSA